MSGLLLQFVHFAMNYGILEKDRLCCRVHRLYTAICGAGGNLNSTTKWLIQYIVDYGRHLKHSFRNSGNQHTHFFIAIVTFFTDKDQLPNLVCCHGNPQFFYINIPLNTWADTRQPPQTHTYTHAHTQRQTYKHTQQEVTFPLHTSLCWPLSSFSVSQQTFQDHKNTVRMCRTHLTWACLEH